MACQPCDTKGLGRCAFDQRRLRHSHRRPSFRIPIHRRRITEPRHHRRREPCRSVVSAGTSLIGVREEEGTKQENGASGPRRPPAQSMMSRALTFLSFFFASARSLFVSPDLQLDTADLERPIFCATASIPPRRSIAARRWACSKTSGVGDGSLLRPRRNVRSDGGVRPASIAAWRNPSFFSTTTAPVRAGVGPSRTPRYCAHQVGQRLTSCGARTGNTPGTPHSRRHMLGVQHPPTSAKNVGHGEKPSGYFRPKSLRR